MLIVNLKNKYIDLIFILLLQHEYILLIVTLSWEKSIRINSKFLIRNSFKNITIYIHTNK